MNDGPDSPRNALIKSVGDSQHMDSPCPSQLQPSIDQSVHSWEHVAANIERFVRRHRSNPADGVSRSVVVVFHEQDVDHGRRFADEARPRPNPRAVTMPVPARIPITRK